MKKHSSAVHSSARACVSVLLSITLASGLFPARVFATDASAAIASSTLTTNAFAETTPTLLDVAATASADDVAASPAEVKFSADPTPATDATLTAGWNQLGTCEWRIDDAGLLTIRPLGNGASGVLDSWSPSYAPWAASEDTRASITAVRIESGVSTPTCRFMFADCASLVSADLSGLDTSQVTDMALMFRNCTALESVDFSGIDASCVTSMYGMFRGCSSIKRIDLSGINAAHMTDMYDLFRDCAALESVDISSFSASAITNAGYSFMGADSLSQLTLPAGLNLTEQESHAYIGVSSTGDRHDSRWVDTTGAVYGSTDEMLRANAMRTTGAETYTVTNAVPSSGWTQSGGCEWMVDSSGLLVVRPLPGFEQGALPDWGEGVYNAPWSGKSEDIVSARFEQGVIAKTCFGLFENCYNLSSFDLSGLDTSQVTDMRYMFDSCAKLTRVDLTGIDNVQKADTTRMFRDCSSLTELILPAGVRLVDDAADNLSWKDATGALYSSTADMLAANAARETGSMTYTAIRPTGGWDRCGTCEWSMSEGELVIRPLPGFTQGTLADWSGNYEDVPWYPWRDGIECIRIEQGVAAKTCYGMFYGCTNLYSAVISELDTSRVADMRLMFANCEQLETIFASKMAIKQVTQSDDMFAGCVALEGGCGTAFNASYTDISRARVDNGAAAPGYFIGRHAKLDGDVSGNGALNIVDAQIAYDIVKSPETYADRADYESMYSRADVKWNNDVDATNAFAIQRAALCGWDD